LFSFPLYAALFASFDTTAQGVDLVGFWFAGQEAKQDIVLLD
jgi:hypothetical protein